MCGFGGVKSMPVVQKAPTPPPVAMPIEADADAKRAGEEERRRRRAASGRSDTILTSGLGAPGAMAVGTKKLLGE